MTAPRAVRCAIYTRKSAEEGLDQAFNSLDAQREACEAYIRSQASEGWFALPTPYEDGGFSGATTQRPALQRLLQGVERGEVDLVIVYKVDRLTRALADFARLIELFDKRGVSFVSVTQAFNTTNSMSRLTLNVLLSFAQFEREITSERIRDKVAASKAKGMWMGGAAPLGYDPPRDAARTLRVNEDEAAVVRLIFKRYLRAKSFTQLARELDRDGIRSKRYVSAAGRTHGGCRFTHGALWHLLRNRIYLGEIVHKGTIHPGKHAAIVDRELFEAVQRAAGRRSQPCRSRMTRAQQTLLNGILFDADGVLMRPVFSYGQVGRRYQYYASAPRHEEQRRPADAIRRAPCHVIDELVRKRVARLLWGRANSIWPDELRTVVSRVEIHPQAVHIVVRPQSLGCGATAADTATVVRLGLQAEERVFEDPEYDGVRIVLPVRLALRGGRQWVIGPDGLPAKPGAPPSATLVRRLRAGHRILTECGIWPIGETLPRYWQAPCSSHQARLAIAGLLAPDIQRAVLSGRVQHLDLERMPLWWADQREMLLSGPPFQS
jgi:DNA invertase Pin-like site-specific DNA recombinase